MDKIRSTGFTERNVSDAVNALIDGRGNMVGEVTLRASQTTTTVAKATINGNGQVFLFPKTANAAGAVATTYAVITPGGGSFTITHANAVSTDRVFAYLVLGG